MRTKKPTRGRVAGVKFTLNKEQEETTDLKKMRAQILKELEENEQKKKEWYDKEMDKNLSKQ